MIERPPEAVFILVVYTLAAITGGLGGCASWAWYAHHTPNKRKFVYLAAYMIIGAVFGVTSASAAMIYNWASTLDQLIFYSLVSGVAGTITIFAVNWGAGVILRWRGIELRLTFRDRKEDRRQSDDDDRN